MAASIRGRLRRWVGRLRGSRRSEASGVESSAPASLSGGDDGPPAHWLERVRRSAPELLRGDVRTVRIPRPLPESARPPENEIAAPPGAGEQRAAARAREYPPPRMGDTAQPSEVEARASGAARMRLRALRGSRDGAAPSIEPVREEVPRRERETSAGPREESPRASSPRAESSAWLRSARSRGVELATRPAPPSPPGSVERGPADPAPPPGIGFEPLAGTAAGAPGGRHVGWIEVDARPLPPAAPPASPGCELPPLDGGEIGARRAAHAVSERVGVYLEPIEPEPRRRDPFAPAAERGESAGAAATDAAARWPALFDAESEESDEGAREWRRRERLGRLEREQRGRLWNA